MLVQSPILHGEGSTVSVESHHIPSGVDVRHGGAATTIYNLDAGQGSGNINKTPSMPYNSPLLRVRTHGSDEGRMQQNELMDLVTKLIDRVLSLETDLQQTMKVYSIAFTKLIMKVNKLEKIVKSTKARRRAKIVVLDDEDAAEDSSKQGRKIDKIDQDPDISLVQHDAENLSLSKPLQSYSKDKKELAMKQLRNNPLTYAQQRTYMSSYVKHMGSHTLQQLKRLSFDELKNLFEATIKRVKTFTSMESDVDKTIPKIAYESSKRDAEEELEQESSKRQKTRESSEPREKEDDELTQEDYNK
nr:hypothetical protein [Tanacetum cinerariifolium]